MENQNNNLQELEELRSQVAEFKNRMEKQEIVNQQMMKQAMTAHVSWIKNFNVGADVVCLFFMPLLAFFLRSIGCSWAPFIVILIILIAELIFNIWNTRSISTKYLMADDVLTYRQRLIKFKQRERWQTMIEVPLLVLWVFWINFDGPGRTSQDQTELVIRFIIALVIGFGRGFYIYYREMRSLNKAIKEIDEFNKNI